jgi:hypothetical protein
VPYVKHVVIYRHYRVIGTVVARLINIVTERKISVTENILLFGLRD